MVYTGIASHVLFDRDSCPNGAAEYLYIAGIIHLVLNLMGFIIPFAKECAEKVRLLRLRKL